MSKGIEKIFKYGAFFISGLISGIAVGLLSAPKSGKELREEIANKSLQWQNTAKNKIEEIEDISKSQADRIAHALRNTADKIGSKFNGLAKKNNDEHILREKEEAIT